MTAETLTHHTCPAPACPHQVPAEQHACRWHWFSLPRTLRDRISDAHGQDPNGGDYAAAMEEARRVLRLPQQHGHQEAKSGRQRSHPPLPEDDPETAAIQLDLDAALTSYARTYLIDSDEERDRKRVAVYRQWLRRHPEGSETSRSTRFERYFQQKSRGAR